jgi:hypothetical protein
MSEDSQSTEPTARTQVERQAIDLLDDAGLNPKLDAVKLVSDLDFGHWQRDDEYPNWHATEPMEPMLRALFLRELMDCRNSNTPYTKTDHEQRMREPGVAEQFGFDLDADEQAPCRTTYDRAWNDRLSDDLRQYLAHTATRVRAYAHEEGIPLGLDELEREPDDKSSASRSTQDRAIRRKTRRVLEQVSGLVFPLIEFGRADNAQYNTETYLGAETLMCLNGVAAEQGMEIYADNAAALAEAQTETDSAVGETGNMPEKASTSPTAELDWMDVDLDSELDERRGEDPDVPETPTGDAHLRTIQLLDHDDILQLVQNGIGVIVNAASRHTDLFERQVTAAIDITTVGYWADGDELEMVMGAPPDKEYDECYEFATLSVVGENTKFTLAMRPRKKGEHYGEVVRDLLMKAKQYVTIDTVYADSAFAAVSVIQALEHHRTKYVIPIPKNVRVKRFIQRMDNDVAVKHDHVMYGQVLGSPQLAPAKTTPVAVPSHNDEDKTVAFITNKDVDDEIGVERRWTKGAIDKYSRRMAIENSYKQIKDFLAWTTSKEYCVRLFHFAFAVFLYNIWLLTDLLVKKALGIDQLKPRLKAKRFLNLLDNFIIPVD